jgi:hypothetical protein
VPLLEPCLKQALLVCFSGFNAQIVLFNKWYENSDISVVTSNTTAGYAGSTAAASAANYAALTTCCVFQPGSL